MIDRLGTFLQPAAAMWPGSRMNKPLRRLAAGRGNPEDPLYGSIETACSALWATFKEEM